MYNFFAKKVPSVVRFKDLLKKSCLSIMRDLLVSCQFNRNFKEISFISKTRKFVTFTGNILVYESLL